MAKSLLTIHKEILKKEHAKSPLGILEKNIGDFYSKMQRDRKQLPEDIAEKIYNIRDANEKNVMAYIEASQKRDKENVDEILLHSMTKEWEIINAYLKNNDS